jgi:hypothetical protein
MGIDPNSIPQTMRRYMEKSPAQIKANAQKVRTSELKEQRQFASWLRIQEEKGELVADSSASNKRPTNKVGFPDFRIYAANQVLLGEMKIPGGKLSEAQKQVHGKFARSRTMVAIWYSAEEAIEDTKEWLATLRS